MSQRKALLHTDCDCCEHALATIAILKSDNFELRTALRAICESAAMTSVADCQIVAEEALQQSAHRASRTV